VRFPICPPWQPWRYFVSFARYSDLLVENREIFILHLHLAPPQAVTPSEFLKMCDGGKPRMIGLAYGENDDMLSRFHLIPERHGRTDRQTDRFAISISRDKKFTV